MDENTSAPALPRGLIGRRGVPPGRSNRLPSIRTPRDLTLGGVPKKSFVPNIPTRRKKEEGQAAVDEKQPRPSNSREKRGRGRGRDERGRGRGRGRPEIIQSHSIFEQGPAERVNKPGHYDSERLGGGGGGGRGGRGGGGGGGGGGRGGGGGGGFSGFKREGDEDTKKILDYILRDDFTVDEDLGGGDPLMTPVKLPVSVKKELKTETETGTIKVKQEVLEDGTEVKMETDQGPAPVPGVAFSSSSSSSTVSSFFLNQDNSDKGEVVYLQLPDVFPGDPPLQDDRQKDKNKPPGTATPADPLGPTEEEKAEEEKLASRLAQCQLVDFTEGFMGKLQIHQSGRARLVLGNVSLDVSMGTPTGFLEDLVSVKTQDDLPAPGTPASTAPGGDMAILGHIHHKLVCSPDFESLIEGR